TAPDLRSALETHIFGPVPTGLPARLISSRVVDPRYKGGRGQLEEYLIEIGEGAEALRFHLAVAFPTTVEGPVPLVIGQTFSQNDSVMENWTLTSPFTGLPGDGEPDSGGAMMGVVKFIFGSYIAKAPTEDYLERGFAFANFYAAELVPDRAGPARAVLSRFPQMADGRRPTGAVAAWAAGYFAAMDILDADPRIDPSQTAVIGHSRHGKSALLAGAFDPRIEAVISHQSGTGGASLSRDKPGETVKQIVRGYPHWFDPGYAAYGDDLDALPVDQHMLIALIAPRRVLLGNGRRDVWSDPNGAYRAAEAASLAWQTLGAPGLVQNGMTDFNPGAGVSYFVRPGGHGIVREDIDAFLAFLDAGFNGSTSSYDTAIR
ncbi:MAG: alpha/beta hydrolase, partial [Pseudomonadota bacterium]